MSYDEKQDSGCKTKEEEQEAYIKLKAARAREDAMFPDETDTPLDCKAKARFARYRGLKSFRTSPWDPKENLPSDYSRIFQFENFDRTRKRVVCDLKKEKKEGADGGIQVGTYVTLHVKDVPQQLYQEWVGERQGSVSKNPLVLFNILPHEQKMCVLNFVVKRTKVYTTIQ